MAIALGAAACDGGAHGLKRPPGVLMRGSVNPMWNCGQECRIAGKAIREKLQHRACLDPCVLIILISKMGCTTAAFPSV